MPFMPVLPQELWSLVVDNIHDYCFAWLVLRRVSPILRRATEDCFARNVIHQCSITFTDASIQHLLWRLWHRLDMSEKDDAETPSEAFSESLALPFASSLSFQPVAFLPPDARTRAVLHLRGESHDRSLEIPDEFFECASRSLHADPPVRGCVYPRDYYLHRQSYTCSAQKDGAGSSTQDVGDERGSPVSLVLLKFGTEKGLERLLERAHFVCLNHQLKTLRIPGIGISRQARLICVDWQSLCQAFYLDELRLRRAENPYYYRKIDPGSLTRDRRLIYHHPCSDELSGNQWLFWDFTATGSTSCMPPYNSWHGST